MRDLTDEITTLSNQQQELSAFRNEQASLTATERHLTQENTQLNNDLEVAVGTHHEALVILAKQQQAQQQQQSLQQVSSVVSMTTLPDALITAILSSASCSTTTAITTSNSIMPSSYSSYSSMSGLPSLSSSSSSSSSLSSIAVQQILARLKSPAELNTLVTMLSQSSGDQSRTLLREREQYQDIKSQRSGKRVNE